MIAQLAFDLPSRPALGRGDFMVAGSNVLALQQIEGWQNWPDARLVLSGPEGSGKTHLARVWAELSGADILKANALPTPLPIEAPALVVEDVDQAAPDPDAQESLFHLHNALFARRAPLLLTGRGTPSQWGLTLPDLASRLTAIPVAALEPPDDALLSGLLVKLFADRQITVTPELITYLVSRIDRSFAAAAAIVATLDEAALAQRRAITRSFAADVIRMSHDSSTTTAP
ncbi:HdaA/DnaA family protein [Halovulum sp. GXIMD14793]